MACAITSVIAQPPLANDPLSNLTMISIVPDVRGQFFLGAKGVLLRNSRIFPDLPSG